MHACLCVCVCVCVCVRVCVFNRFQAFIYICLFGIIIPCRNEVSGDVFESLCPCVHLSRFCQNGISQTAKPFVTWYCGILPRDKSVMLKNCFAIFKVKVTARVHIIKKSLFLLYFLNLYVCNKPWFDGTSSWVGVSCEKLDCCVQSESHSEGL